MLLTRRQAAFIRLMTYRWHERLCHGCTGLRDWLGRVAERTANQRLMLFHTAVWIVAALWLFFQAIILVDANFPLIAAERYLQSLRDRYPWFHLVVTHLRPLGGALVIAWLRDMANDWFRLRQDTVRATTLIKSWLACLTVIAIFSGIFHHRFIYPEDVVETNMFILTLLIMKWASRQATYGKRSDASPTTKRAISVMNIVLKYLVRRPGR